MNEAERYLNEKLNPSRPTTQTTDVKGRPPILPHKAEPVHEQSHAAATQPTDSSAANPQGSSSAGKYVLAVIVCLAIIVGYVLIAAMMNWRRGGGYVAMVLVFMAVVGAWKVITSKQ